MKSLVAGIVLILVIGIGGFIYRNVQERTGPNQLACTEEAKLCPDGKAVGRSGPACEFAPCPFPNVEIPDARIAFAVPEGYTPDEEAYGADPSLIAAFEKPSASESVTHRITVRQYPLGGGETAEDVILAHTRYQPADMQAEDFSRFETVFINGKEFRGTVIERFEALVESKYFLVRDTDVLVFSVVEHDVTGWMEADTVITEIPEHAALLAMLSTLLP
jgi:hypothetical protein